MKKITPVWKISAEWQWCMRNFNIFLVFLSVVTTRSPVTTTEKIVKICIYLSSMSYPWLWKKGDRGYLRDNCQEIFGSFKSDTAQWNLCHRSYCLSRCSAVISILPRDRAREQILALASTLHNKGHDQHISIYLVHHGPKRAGIFKTNFNRRRS